MGIGNLGLTEILVIGAIVLVFFGPRRMPEIAAGLGRAMREFKRGLNEIQREFEEMERQAGYDRPQEERPGPRPGSTVTPPGREGGRSSAPSPGAGESSEPDRAAGEPGQTKGGEPDEPGRDGPDGGSEPERS